MAPTRPLVSPYEAKIAPENKKAHSLRVGRSLFFGSVLQLRPSLEFWPRTKTKSIGGPGIAVCGDSRIGSRGHLSLNLSGGLVYFVFCRMTTANYASEPSASIQEHLNIRAPQYKSTSI